MSTSASALGRVAGDERPPGSVISRRRQSTPHRSACGTPLYRPYFPFNQRKMLNSIGRYREDTSMAHYMIEFKYGIDNIKGLVQKPENRTTLIRQSLESFN